MKTLMLLTSTIGDYIEANSSCIDTKLLWIIVRCWHPEGEDVVVDGFVNEIRKPLDELVVVRGAEMSDECDLSDATEKRKSIHGGQGADSEAVMEILDASEVAHPRDKRREVSVSREEVLP
jgi:hypothetical protein